MRPKLDVEVHPAGCHVIIHHHFQELQLVIKACRHDNKINSSSSSGGGSGSIRLDLEGAQLDVQVYPASRHVIINHNLKTLQLVVKACRNISSSSSSTSSGSTGLMTTLAEGADVDGCSGAPHAQRHAIINCHLWTLQLLATPADTNIRVHCLAAAAAAGARCSSLFCHM
jgi:hypothetical protein